MFSRHGLPNTLKTDNGPQFIATEFRAFCDLNGVVHIKTTPRWAQANGEVERQNRSIVKRIKIAQTEGLDWKKELRRYVFKYRSTEHSSTGKSPAELLSNRKIKGKLPDTTDYQPLDLDTRDREIMNKKEKQKYMQMIREVQDHLQST
jgi:transposase InsO family protein